MTSFTEQGKIFEQQAREEKDPVKAGELFEKANRQFDLAKDQFIASPTVEEDNTACLTCDHAEMGWCNAHQRTVRPMDNCSDFPVVRMYSRRSKTLLQGN